MAAAGISTSLVRSRQVESFFVALARSASPQMEAFRASLSPMPYAARGSFSFDLALIMKPRSAMNANVRIALSPITTPQCRR